MRPATVALLGAAGSLAMTAFATVPADGVPSPARTAPPGLAAWPRPVAPESTDSPETAGTAKAAHRAAAAGITWGACAEQGLDAPVRCGEVSVPLDYADPDGRQLTLAVSRAPATGKNTESAATAHDSAKAADGSNTAEVAGPMSDGTRPAGPGRTGHRPAARTSATGETRPATADPATPEPRPVHRQGALVFNPGGPGANGIYFPLLSGFGSWAPVSAAYDLVGYAPRGVGSSAPLSCQDPKRPQTAPDQAPVHPSAAYKRERVAKAKAYAEGCARENGDALRFYTTLNNARDLDVLRAALGERRLTFIGASYGTYIGAVYATLFPSHVRRMVFDSVVDPSPGQVWYRDNLAQSAAFEDRWSDFCAWVARHDDVYGLGGTADQVRRSYEKARTQLAEKPAGGTIGPGLLHGAFLKAVYFDDYWPMRAAALSAYLDGSPDLLVQQASPVEEAAAEQENSSAVYTAVECNDASWPTDWKTWDRDATRLARTAPFETWDNVWTNLPCAYWSAPHQRPVDVRAAKGTLPPTLIMAAQRDAVTPYKGALELHTRLGGSALVTERDAGTHGVSGGSNDCVDDRLRTYLLSGRVPARDTFCAPRAEPKPISLRTRR